MAVTDVDSKAAERCASECDIDTVTGDYRCILENPDIEAVLICSSTDTHSRLIEEAAEAGKHVFCEKPIDFDLSRIDKALNEVDRAGVKLQIGFQRRFDPNFIKVRALIQEGTLGEPYILRITSRDPEPPPISYLDMMIHRRSGYGYDQRVEVFGSGGKEAFVAEMKEFIRCVSEDETPAVTGTDGRIPVVMGRVAKKSLVENRPVKLNEL